LLLLLLPWCLMFGDDLLLPISYTGVGDARAAVGTGVGRGLAYSALPGCGTAADTSTSLVAASSAELATFVSDLTTRR
jgi:hypothetical protein